MANIVDKDDFIGLYHIDTTITLVVVHLNNIITQLEEKYLAEIEYDNLNTEQSNDIKKMLIGFIYFYFVQDEETANMTIGNVSQNAVNGTKIIDKNKLIRAWNMAVDIYNNYTILEEKKSINTFDV